MYLSSLFSKQGIYLFLPLCLLYGPTFFSLAFSHLLSFWRYRSTCEILKESWRNQFLYFFLFILDLLLFYYSFYFHCFSPFSFLFLFSFFLCSLSSCLFLSSLFFLLFFPSQFPLLRSLLLFIFFRISCCLHLLCFPVNFKIVASKL